MNAGPYLLDQAQDQGLADLGQRIRMARLRRQLTAEQVAGQAGITRMTLHRAERGEPALGLGNLVKILGVLGLGGTLADLAREDTAGHALQDERLTQRKPLRRRRIRVDQYPQLQQLAWNLTPDTELSPEEALALYERNWRHVEPSALKARERELLRRLVRTVGKGVLLV